MWLELNLNRRMITAVVLVVAVIAVAAAAAGDLGFFAKGKTSTECTKPAGGFLIIATSNGYNDSISHGPNPWPVITVSKGTTVNLTVCNNDRQVHGFQITHYFDSSIGSVAPGQVIKLSFVADKTGTFQIYCSIFCTIHVYMQNAELRVT